MTRWPTVLTILLFIWVSLAAVTLVSLLMRAEYPALPSIDEEFDPQLGGVDSVDEFTLALDKAMPNASPREKLDAADAILRRRFVHGYSFFRFDQDWLAASLRPLWLDLASPVRPDDILKFRRAACSQQSLVFLEVARRLGFDSAVVSAPGHFLAAVKLDGRWWVYDANREIRVRRYPLEWAESGDARLLDFYREPYGRQMVDAARAGQVYLREVNRNPAPQASLLHGATWLFSHFGWLAAMLLWLCFRSSGTARRLMSGSAIPEPAKSRFAPWLPRIRSASGR